MTTSPPESPPFLPSTTPVSLPTSRLLGAVVGTSMGVGAVWAAIAWGIGRSGMEILAGPAGAAVVAVAGGAGLMAIMPWRKRLLSLWISIWLGQTLVRMILAPSLAYLLYSAASFPGPSLWLAVGSTYVIAVFVEAGILARFLKTLSPNSASCPTSPPSP